MANIARVTATNEWQKVEDLVEGFTPEADSKYQIQNIGSVSLQIYEGAEEPTNEKDGFVLTLNKGAIYTKKTDEYLFIRSMDNEKVAVMNIASI